MSNYKKEIDDFKNEIRRQYRVNDSHRPVKGTKRLEINVVETEPGEKGRVFLWYAEEFRRIFGKENHAFCAIYEGDLKTACNIARDLKKELPSFTIIFQEYTEPEFF